MRLTTKPQQQIHKGIAFLLLFTMSIPLASYIRSQIGLSMNAGMLIFFSVLWAFLFYHLINIGHIKHNYRLLLQHKRRYIALMLCVACVWLGTFLIPMYYSSFVDLFSFFSIQALIGYFYKYIKLSNKLNLLLLISVVLLNLYFLYHISTIFLWHETMLCYLLIILVACGAWKYKTTSYAFKDILPTSFIIASRFYILFIVAIIMWAFQEHIILPNSVDILKTILISVTSLIIPIYFSQRSIEILSPISNSIGSSFSPLLVCIIEEIMSTNKINSGLAIILSLLLMLLMVIPIMNEVQLKFTNFNKFFKFYKK